METVREIEQHFGRKIDKMEIDTLGSGILEMMYTMYRQCTYRLQ